MANHDVVKSTYYFDGSDAAASDPNNVWTNETNADDGVLTTYANTTTAGTTSANFLKIDGTNAPSSGGIITSVRARVFGSAAGVGPAVVTIYTDALAETLGTITYDLGVNENWSAWSTLTAPAAGWTWASIQALELKAYGASITSMRVYRVDVEVTYQSYAVNAESFADFYVGSPSVSAPTVTTTAPTNLLQTTARVQGEVTDDGDGAITERGFVWDLESAADPTTGTNLGKKTVPGTTGLMFADMTLLEPNTQYTVRAYAINSAGTSYGSAQNFTTANYKTFTVGGVIWNIGGGETTLILYNKTDSLEVPDSEVTTTNWYPTLVTRELAYNAMYFTDTDAFEYRVKATSGSTAMVDSTKLFIRIGNATKVTSHNRISRFGFTALSADAAVTTSRFLYTAGDYSSPVTDWEITGSEDGGAGTSVFQVYNVTTTDSGTTGSAVGSTNIDVNVATKTRSRVNAITMVDTNRYIGLYDWTSGGARYHQGLLMIEASGGAGTVDTASMVELLDVPRSSVIDATYTPKISHTPFRTTDYDGTVTYYWENIATNSHASNAYSVTLIAVNKEGTETTVTTQSLTANTGSSNVRYRTGSINIPTDTVMLKVMLPQTAAAKNVVLGSSRIYVKQVNFSKTVLQVPMGGGNTEWNNDVTNPMVTTTQTSHGLLALNADQFTIFLRTDSEYATYFELAAPQYTKFHTTDALKRKQFTPYHTTDANKKKATTVSHTTSANLVDGVYTYEDKATLPTTDALLANSYNNTDRSNIATDDNVYKDLTGSAFLIEQLWIYHTNNTDAIIATWKGKSTLAPTSSTVYLQVYNHNTDTWTTLDSDNTTAADTEFTLTGEQGTSLANYYDTGNRIAIRVYQEAV